MLKRSEMKILVIHGPNLNRLGTREPEVYGTQTLTQLDQDLVSYGESLSISIQCMQSNHEGALVDSIHQACDEDIDAVVINPAAYTHTSIAIRDAFLATQIPFVEVHLSNVHSREEFRHRSLLADIAQGVICGFGTKGYQLAIDGLLNQIKPLN
jgi:3-dehydroquinate dehydratase II